MAETLRVRAGRRTLEISNPGRVYFPDDGITKADVIEHYRTVAPAMIPHLRGRPAMLQRFPSGIGAGGFYQKNVGEGVPDWVHRVTVPKKGGTVTHPLIDDVATLLVFAGQGSIVPHVWTSRADRLQEPDQIIWDLDPSTDDFEPVRAGAFILRELLEQAGLVPFLKTTGSRGLHIVTPIRRGPDFEAVLTFSEAVAGLLVERDDRFTTKFMKKDRGDRVFVDTMRNKYAQTAVPAYALRAKAGAPAAVPIEWDELEDPKLGPTSFTIRDVPKRLESVDDPWQGMARRARSLPSI